MSSRTLHLDFETFSRADLKAVGVENYIAAPDFCVTVVAWAFDDGPVQSRVWPDILLPEMVRKHMDSGGMVSAWNAAFEWNVLTRHYGLTIPHEQMDCTMQRALAWGLPASLLEAGKAIPAPVIKDESKKRLMLAMGKPRKDGSAWHEDRGVVGLLKLGELRRYCEQDVEAERSAGRLIPPLAKFEKALSVADARINEKGVQVDMAAVAGLTKAALFQRLRLDAECATLTGGQVTSPGTETAKLLAWLQGEKVNIVDLTKESVAHALMVLTKFRGLHDRARRVLELRQLAAKASVAKLERMAGWASGKDGRARNLLQFYGAGRTGRWAGRGIQVQNLPRPEKGLDAGAVIDVAKANHEALGLFHASPMKAISGALRGCLTARPGHLLVSIDLSQIEARVLAWLAGQQDVLDTFRRGEDVYVMQAAKVGSTNRQLGKVLVLACGFGMGAAKFKDTAEKDYGVVLTDAGAAWALSRWRHDNAGIVGYWRQLLLAVEAAVFAPGKEVWLDHGVAVRMQKGVLQLRKPNGVKLAYHGMRMEGGGLVFDGVNSKTKKWGRERTYGGRLVENLVQSVARDVMAVAILADTHVPVMSVHDEIVWEAPEEVAEMMAKLMKATVETPPAWGKGLPLASEVKISRRYGK